MQRACAMRMEPGPRLRITRSAEPHSRFCRRRKYSRLVFISVLIFEPQRAPNRMSNDAETDRTLSHQELQSVKETSKIFFFGYVISLIALMIALFIFLYFK